MSQNNLEEEAHRTKVFEDHLGKLTVLLVGAHLLGWGVSSGAASREEGVPSSPLRGLSFLGGIVDVLSLVVE